MNVRMQRGHLWVGCLQSHGFFVHDVGVPLEDKVKPDAEQSLVFGIGMRRAQRVNLSQTRRSGLCKNGKEPLRRLLAQQSHLAACSGAVDGRRRGAAAAVTGAASSPVGGAAGVSGMRVASVIRQL